uniref:A-kinase anchor protein 2 C-terminal domain-containing protein n=1 Tax=Leptobrachium leishanense TaxID=445787 RepID=A0A8C5N0C9_9ANUR
MDTTKHPYDTCVKETVTPVKEVRTYGEGGGESSAGEHGTEEDILSAVKVTGSGVQVTAEEAGEAVMGADTLEVGKDIQVAGGETVTRLPVTGEETDTLTRVRGEEAEVTGNKSGVEEHKSSLTEKSPEPPFACTPSAVEEFTGARVKSAEDEADVAGDSGTGGQVSASGEKAERKVTPDPSLVPSGEGAAGPDRPAACREKEWPPLMCTGREERADAAGQAEIREEKVTEKELRLETPEMKDREYVEADAMPPAETPIEREIRLAIERENILRQERGICSPTGQQELVEVRRRTLVVEKGPPVGKERQLAGAQMQRDIQLESRREQDLVQLGKVMGTYDRGPQQELQERKQVFENVSTVPSEPVFKKRQSASLQAAGGKTPISVAPALSVNWPHGAPKPGGRKGPSYMEANGSNIILIEHSAVLQRSAPTTNSTLAPADLPRPTKSDSPQPASGKPYQATRSSSPRSLLEREIEEVQEREKALRKQRTSVYGSNESLVDGPKRRSENRGDVLSGIYQPERPNWRKLDVNWPPNPDAMTNGQQADQSLDGPRRQRSALIRSWEAGTPSPLNE